MASVARLGPTLVAKDARGKAGTLYLMHVLTHATRARLDDALAHLELSAFQYTILDVINRNAGLSASRVSRRFHVTPQAMGELILNPERRGLVKRREDPKNRKALHLSLTPEGKRVVATGNKIRKELEQQLFSSFSAEKMQEFRDIISAALDLVRHRQA